MIEALIKITGSLFIGGIGLGLILVCTLIITVMIKEVISKIKE